MKKGIIGLCIISMLLNSVCVQNVKADSLNA